MYKMVNGFRYYRALESFSTIASALYSALTIYPCQIRLHQRWQSKLPTAYSSEEGVAAGHSGQFTPMRLPVNTVIHTTLVGLELATFRSLVRRTTVVPPSHKGQTYDVLFLPVTAALYTDCTVQYTDLLVENHKFYTSAFIVPVGILKYALVCRKQKMTGLSEFQRFIKPLRHNTTSWWTNRHLMTA